jgi:hypothetical protein
MDQPPNQAIYETVDKFDRIRGGLHDVAIFTKPSTVKNVQNITGKTETFVVETCRYEDEGDYIFIECVDESGVTRLALPPKVSRLIASQRDALTAKRRSKAANARAALLTDEDKDKLRARLAKARKARKRKTRKNES